MQDAVDQPARPNEVVQDERIGQSSWRVHDRIAGEGCDVVDCATSRTQVDSRSAFVSCDARNTKVDAESSFLSCPSVSTSPHETHPFSIANMPNDRDEAVFLIRVHSGELSVEWESPSSCPGFTRRLRDRLSGEVTTDIPVYLEGPYGSSHALSSYSTVVLVAGELIGAFAESQAHEQAVQASPFSPPISSVSFSQPYPPFRDTCTWYGTSGMRPM